MTPEQTQELAALKAALKQHIEEAEKAAPGPWHTPKGYETHVVSHADTECVLKCDTSPRSFFWDIPNAAFIARARTMSPLACRIALEAIKALEEIVAEDKDQLMAADHDLIFILDLWKGGEA